MPPPAAVPALAPRATAGQAPTAGLARAPLAQKHAGREGVGSFLGKAGRRGGSSSTKLQGDGAWEAHLPRKVWSRPPGSAQAPEPAASERPGPRRWFISEVTPRSPGGAARPNGHERGFLQLPRPLRLPQGRLPCSPQAAPLGPAPSRRRAGLGTGSRARRNEGGRRTALPDALALRPPGAWPRSEQPGPRQLHPRRGVSAARVSRVHIAAHPQRRSWLAPGGPRRRLTASPLSWARVAKPGVPSFPISGPLRPGPRARSPAPAGLANSGGTRLPGDGGRAGSASGQPAQARANRARCSSREPRAADGCSAGPLRAELLLSPPQPASQPPTLPHRAVPPLPLPGGSALLPTAGGFAGRGSRLSAEERAAGAVKSGEPLRAYARSAGSGGRSRSARAPSGRGRRRQLTRSAPESESSRTSTPETAGIFPAAPRPAPVLPVPEPQARSPPPLLRGLHASSPAAARSLGPVSPPASQPPAPLFRAL